MSEEKKLGVLWLGHSDYLDENTANIQREIHGTLSQIPHVASELSPLACTDEDAVAAARKLMQKGCCGAVIVLTTWVECNIVMSAWKEMRGLPCLFWGFPVEEVCGIRESTGAYVSASMFAGVIRRVGARCPVLYGSFRDEKTLHDIAVFASAAACAGTLTYSRMGLIGYTSMSIYTGTFDHVLMRYLVGPEVEQMDTYSLLREAEQTTPEELAEARKKLSALTSLRSDAEPYLDKTLAMYTAMKKLCQSHNWSAVNVKCQYELSKEYKAVPCVALSLLAEDGITASCEGDTPCTVSMMMLRELTGQTVWYGDSLTHRGNTVQFSPCGFLPFSLALGKTQVGQFMDHPGFKGIQVCGVLRPEKVTFLRLVEDIGSYHLLYGTGTGVETQPRDGTMPALNVLLDGSTEALCREYAGQHFALCYGDYSAELEALGSIMGIETRRV